MVFEPISDACGPVHKGEVEDYYIPPCLISRDNAALPSAPSVTVWGEKEAKKGTEISLAAPSVGLLNMEPSLVTHLWSLPLWVLWKTSVRMREQNWVLS